MPTQDPQAIAAAISRLRGVPSQAIAVPRVLPQEAFVAEFHASAPAEHPSARRDAFWTAFHFSADEQEARGAEQRAYDESLTGFYRSNTGKLFLRANTGPLDMQRFTMAHEIAHAIQRRLGIAPLQGSDDERLAWRAMVEGDANVTAAAFLAQDESRSIGVSVARIAGRLQRMSAISLMTVAHAAPSVRSAPSLVRARLVFPYLEGTTLATALYQTGGFALLNAALQHPPVTTAQVLHPDKYVAGEMPVRVSPPEVAGRTVVESGTLGELQTSVYLAACIDDRVARRVAQGWAGTRTPSCSATRAPLT